MKRISNRTVLYIAVSMLIVTVFLFTHRDMEVLKIRFLSNAVAGFYSFTEKSIFPNKGVENGSSQKGLPASDTDAKAYYDNNVNKVATKNNSIKPEGSMIGSKNAMLENPSGSGVNKPMGIGSPSKSTRANRTPANRTPAASQMSKNEAVTDNMNAASGIQKVTTQPAEPGSSSSPSLGTLALGDGTLVLLMMASVYILKKRL